MKVPKHHYSKFLISVLFERFLSSTELSGMNEQCLNFLYDLGQLARKNGKRLHGTYSIVDGETGYHAHFAVSWLPTFRAARSLHGNRRITIDRAEVCHLLEQNYFYCDHIMEGIKPVTYDKRYLTNYVIYQPKQHQNVMFSDFYIHPDFVPVYSEIKMKSYCSKRQFHFFQKSEQIGCLNKAYKFLVISIYALIVISDLMLTLF